VIEVTHVTDIEPLLTVADLARWLRKHENQIRRMAGDGTIPALRIGETWRFDRREIERWLRGEGPARTEETD
jgi:excisionase family DNA binding protein